MNFAQYSFPFYRREHNYQPDKIKIKKNKN